MGCLTKSYGNKSKDPLFCALAYTSEGGGGVTSPMIILLSFTIKF